MSKKILKNWPIFTFLPLAAALAYASDLGGPILRMGAHDHPVNPNFQDFSKVIASLVSAGDPRAETLIRSVDSIGRIAAGCTGWLLTPRVLVTNDHCVKDDYKAVSPDDATTTQAYTPSACDSFSVNFNAERPWSRPADLAEVSQLGDFHCRRILLANPALDLALIELDRSVPAVITPFKLARDFTPNGQPVMIIGHPAGSPKQVSQFHKTWRQDDVCRASPIAFPPDGRGPMDDHHPHHRLKNAHSFEHTCSTLGGSSGSPVLNAETLEVVGLHWGGYDEGGSMCTWGHYDPRASADYDKSYRQNYHPGNTAILGTEIREFLLKLTESDLHPTTARMSDGPSVAELLKEIQQAVD